jgi:hypothetical protein
MSLRPRIAFDTSGINALEDGGSQSEPLMKALSCGFAVLVTAMSVDEVLSTKDPLRREALLSRCQRLLGRCVLPPHWIIQLLISEHLRDSVRFDWPQIDVEAKFYERALVQRDFTEELCAQQRQEQFRHQEQFANFWRHLRPKLDPVLAKEPEKRPTSFTQAAEIARMDGGVLWGIGAELYKHETGVRPSDMEIKAFMDVCPPFLAACYGLCGAWYDDSLKPLDDGTPSVGRNDLMMAAYLPYCGRFVTHDWPQEERLREISAEARIDCEVISYENFSVGFLVAP